MTVLGRAYTEGDALGTDLGSSIDCPVYLSSPLLYNLPALSARQSCEFLSNHSMSASCTSKLTSYSIELLLSLAHQSNHG